MFTCCQDFGVCMDRIAGDPTILLLQELHREMDALEFAALDRQIAGDARTNAEAHRVELLLELFSGDVFANVDAGTKLDAFGFHLLDATCDQRLLQLEVGNAVGEQAADAIIAFEHRDGVSGASELLSRRHAGRARTYHRNLLASLYLGG